MRARRRGQPVPQLGGGQVDRVEAGSKNARCLALGCGPNESIARMNAGHTTAIHALNTTRRQLNALARQTRFSSL